MYISPSVAAGSIAAGVQSAIYGGATAGVFSALQAVGAAGVGSTAAVAGGGIGAAVGALLKR